MKNKSLVLREAEYILEKKETIRNISKIFHRSKSSIHKDLSIHLSKIDYEKYLRIQELFQTHKNNRHIKGGESTRKKYQLLK